MEGTYVDFAAEADRVMLMMQMAGNYNFPGDSYRDDSQYFESSWVRAGLYDSRPYGCMGANFGPANNIPMGGEDYVSRSSLTRELWTR